MTARAEVEGWLAVLPEEAQQVMRPLVEPLLDAWESVTGDAAAVTAAAQEWRGMAAGLREVRADQLDSLAVTLPAWRGEAAASWAVAVDAVLEEVAELADRVQGVGELLERAAAEVAEVERLVADLVRELLEWAAIHLALSVAASVVSAGASVVAGAAGAVAKAGVTGAKVARLLERLAGVLRWVAEAVRAYQQWVKELGTVRRLLHRTAAERPVVRALTGLDGDVVPPTRSLLEIGLGEPRPATG